MAQTVSIIINAEDRERLAAIIGDRNRPQKHVQRARIVLHSGEHLPVIEVARQVGSSRPAVWRWQQRFAEEGVDGLLRDKTREPGKAPLPLETVAKVLTLPCSNPPGSTTHWTGRMVAKSVGVSLSAVQRLWNEHSLQPHRLRTFKRSKDPPFAKKVEDMVGLYMEPRPATRCCPSTRRAGYRHATARSRPNLERTGALEAYPRLICSEERPIERRGLAEALNIRRTTTMSGALRDLGSSSRPLSGATITLLNDLHGRSAAGRAASRTAGFRIIETDP